MRCRVRVSTDTPPLCNAGERGFLTFDPGRTGVPIERDGESTDARVETAVDGGELPAVAAKRRVLSDHRDTVQAVIEAADAVADDWTARFVVDRTDVVEPMEAELRARETNAELLTVLTESVESAGYALRGTPVPAPPYLAVTGQGPVLRGTVENGRLVLEFQVFGIERTDDGPRYVRTSTTPESVLSVELRGDPSWE
jgi:hypothetical protein